MPTENTQQTERKCGVNCFRYLPQNEGQISANYNCYVGSSSGATVGLGNSCVWADIFTSPADPGNPRTPAESELFAKFSGLKPPVSPVPSDDDAIAHHNEQRWQRTRQGLQRHAQDIINRTRIPK